MAIRRKKRELIPELKNPSDPEPDWCSPGSIEQKLDMCESGSLRGDDILHSHGVEPPAYTGDPVAMDKLLDQNWEMDLSEVDREGDEMSGDEHSSGLEGNEPELEGQPNISTGLPGDLTRREELELRSDHYLHPEETEIRQTLGNKIIPIRKRKD